MSYLFCSCKVLHTYKGEYARFDEPWGLDVHTDGLAVVADSNNHIIRTVNASGYVETLAGRVTIKERNEVSGVRRGVICEQRKPICDKLE